MRLHSIEYSESAGSSQEWKLAKMRLGPIMLIVGRNSSGKSRTLRVVNGLAECLRGRSSLVMGGEFKAVFVDGDVEFNYSLMLEGGVVLAESLHRGTEMLFERDERGFGSILFEPLKLHHDFEVDRNKIIAFTKQDRVMHPFLEPLFQWANALRYYSCNNISHGDLIVLQEGAPEIDDRFQGAPGAIFRKGLKKFGDEFVRSIIADMRTVNYSLDEISLSSSITLRITFDGAFPGEPLVLSVKETDLPGVTDQIAMSTGMYRVLALLIYVNYAQFNGAADSILIDDIGEGLDFERSCKLIELLRCKAQQYNFQLIMTTNDKFVMNHVPLEEWTVLQRTNNRVNVRNYENSSEIFDEFRFTGLSNFSFFEMNVTGMDESQFSEVSDA